MSVKGSGKLTKGRCVVIEVVLYRRDGPGEIEWECTLECRGVWLERPVLAPPVGRVGQEGYEGGGDGRGGVVKVGVE